MQWLLCMSLMRLQSFSLKGRRLREELVKTHQAWHELAWNCFLLKTYPGKQDLLGTWWNEWEQVWDRRNTSCSVQTTAARGIKICEAATACILEPRKKDGFGKQRMWHYKGRKESLICASCCRSVIGRTERWGFYMSNITSKGMELMHICQRKKSLKAQN